MGRLARFWPGLEAPPAPLQQYSSSGDWQQRVHRAAQVSAHFVQWLLVALGKVTPPPTPPPPPPLGPVEAPGIIYSQSG